MSLLRLLPLFMWFALIGCSKPVAPVVTTATKSEDPVANGPFYFRDVTAQTGIDFTYRNGEESEHYAILESLGGGVAMFDYDRDGKLDLFAPGGGYYDGANKRDIKGYPGRMYRNLGDWKFEDVTKSVGLDAALMYSHGATATDYDNDGFPDLLVTGYGRMVLFHNVNGQKFVEVTKDAGLIMDRHFWSTSAAFADFDGDGFADLYVCQYVNWSWENNPSCPGYSIRFKNDVCPPKQFGSVPHALFRNNGNGTFTDVTFESGIRFDTPEKDYGKGLGVLAVDVNADRKPDIYVCNDTTDNFLYLNRSTPGKIRFDDVGFNLGVARDGGGIPNGSMGIDAGDYDRSGRPSIWVTNYENEFHALYRNETKTPDKLAFTYATTAAGIGAIGPKFVGFGTGFVDLDRDGWEDLIVANGHVVHFPPNDNLRQTPVLMLNTDENGRRKFKFANAAAGPFQKPIRGRGLAIGDLDNDGAADLVFACNNEPLVMLRNECKEVIPDRHWVGVELVGVKQRDIVGTRLTLSIGDQKLTQFVKGGGSYLSTCDRRLLFGANTSTQVGPLTVEWASGEPTTEVFEGLKIDQYAKIEQGKGRKP